VFDFQGRKRALTPTQEEIDRNPPVRHPIVRTHPSTGRKCLYVMRDDCTGIEGMEPDEAEALIAALADHIVKPAFVYRHQWRPGDVLMWDDCMVQHRAIQDYDMPPAPLDASYDDGWRRPRVTNLLGGGASRLERLGARLPSSHLTPCGAPLLLRAGSVAEE
jgi:hypothetical protein